MINTKNFICCLHGTKLGFGRKYLRLQLYWEEEECVVSLFLCVKLLVLESNCVSKCIKMRQLTICVNLV